MAGFFCWSNSQLTHDCYNQKFLLLESMRIIDYLKTPFPRPKRNRKNLLLVVFLGVSASVFILLYKPFGIENNAGDLATDLVIGSLGLVFILSVLFMEWGMPWLFPKLFKRWTLGKALLWYTLVILFVAVMNFLYKSWWSSFREFTWTDFGLVLGRVLGISFTVSFFVLGLWQYLNRKKLSLITSNENYKVTADNGDEYSLNLKQLLYLSSDDNYVDVHYLEDRDRKKIVLRSSLKNIETQIVNPLSPIYRCHRSYLINAERFKIAKQTSRSMTLVLKEGDDEVPVSKQFISEINTRL